MRVADFFCGAGGFSEGFRQAGFKIAFALDKWQLAVNTHHANHPTAKTIMADIEKISLLPDEKFEEIIPDTEIIIGSPPCVAFSNSNKSGKGDKTLGIRLLKAYLRIIARKKFKKNSILKYWVLENVPNIRAHIQETYSAEELELKGDFCLNVLNESAGIYNAKNFGVASNRVRFLCGEFPKPQQVITKEEDVVTLRAVLQGVGIPLENITGVTQDPNYDFFMNTVEVTDHHFINELAEFEWKKAKRLKEDKGYMGKMSFPENMDRPARTVMATMSRSSRESMIFPYKQFRYRLPTVREVASIMSFPIDYRFYGSSLGTKYTLVGNAVPPKLSYALAKAIAQKERLLLNEIYMPLNHDNQCEFQNLNFIEIPLNQEKQKRKNARFKYHIPYMIINAFRVELTNYNSNFNEGCYRWDTEIHKSQGKRAKVYTPDIGIEYIPENLRENVVLFVNQLKVESSSFNKFQELFCLIEEKQTNMIAPYQLLDKIKEFIEVTIPENNRKNLIGIKGLIELPLAIVVGYYVLLEVTKYMGGLTDE